MIYIGIDPGVKGGEFGIDSSGRYECNSQTYESLVFWMRRGGPMQKINPKNSRVFMEDVGGMAGDTPNTAFVLGKTVGFWEATLCASGLTEWTLVKPHLWQSRFARQFGDRWCPKDRKARKKYIHEKVNSVLPVPVTLELADAAAIAWLASKELI